MPTVNVPRNPERWKANEKDDCVMLFFTTIENDLRELRVD